MLDGGMAGRGEGVTGGRTSGGGGEGEEERGSGCRGWVSL